MVQQHIFVPPYMIFSLISWVIQQRPNLLVYLHIDLACDDILRYQIFHGSQKTSGYHNDWTLLGGWLRFHVQTNYCYALSNCGASNQCISYKLTSC